MATMQRRRERAHAVEVAGGTTAAAAGTMVGAERVRDAYKHDNPRALRRAAAKAGPFKQTVLHGRTPAKVIAAGTAAGGVSYVANKYQERSLTRESQRNKTAAHHLREQIGPKGAGMGPLQSEVAKSDRNRRNTAAAASAGGGALALSARASKAKAGRAASTAGNLRHARNAALGAAVAPGALSGIDIQRRVGRVRAVGRTDAHGMTPPAAPAAPVHPGHPAMPAAGPVPDPPKKHPKTGKVHPASQARYERQKALSDAMHQHKLRQWSQAKDAIDTSHQHAVLAHQGLLEQHQRNLRTFGEQVGRHPANRKLRRAMAGREALRAATNPAHAATAGLLGAAGGAHLGARAAAKQATRHTRAFHTKAGAAAGLLAVAAGAHHNRQRPRQVSYY